MRLNNCYKFSHLDLFSKIHFKTWIQNITVLIILKITAERPDVCRVRVCIVL